MKKTIPWALTWFLALMFVFNINTQAQEVIAYWNQNSNDLPGGGFGFLAVPDDFPQAADLGEGFITAGGGILSETITNANDDVVYRWIQSTAGTTLNAQTDVVAGGSIAIQGGTDNGNNGSYIQFQFSSEGYENLSITYASQGTGTGFNSQAWSWSADGVTFTDISVFTAIETTYAATGVVTIVLPEAANDLQTVYLKVTLTGATGTLGNNRFDNITILGTPIVEVFDMVTFYFKGPGWMDNNPHNPEVWGPFTGMDWTSETLALDSDLGWWKADVDVTDAAAMLTYQMRFSENGVTKYQKAPDGSDPTFTTTTGEIWIDASGDLIWEVGGADDFALAPEYITEEEPVEDPFVTLFQAIPDYFNVTGHTERGFSVDANNVYVASRNAGTFIRVHDRVTGAVTGDLVTTGISGGVFALNDIEVTADGVIIAGNLSQTTAPDQNGNFKLYVVNATDPAQELIVYTWSHNEVGAKRFGDKFTVVGSISDGSAVIYAADGSGPRVLKWSMIEDDTDGFVFGDPEVVTIGVAHGATPVVAPRPDGSFYYTASGHPVSLLNADGTLVGAISTDFVASSSTAMKYLGTDGADDLLAVYQNGPGNENIRVVRVINGDPSNVVIEFITPSMFVNANPNGTGDVAFIPNLNKESGNVDLYVMGTNNGVGGYTSQLLDITFPVYLPPSEEPVFARAQIIHNSADPAAAVVDVFVNGAMFLPNVPFRAATAFTDVPAGVELTIDIAPAGAGIGASVGTFVVTLVEGETYVIVANGLIPENGEKEVTTDFTLFTFDQAREEALEATNTDILVFHGATDAPEVSVWVMGGESQLFAFEYGDFAGYLSVPTADLVLEVRTSDGETVVAAFEAPLATLGLEGEAITVLASGFLTPGDGEAAFALVVATADGGVLAELPAYEPPATYTVTFVVEDEEGIAIADAVVTLDGVTNNAGDYVFEDLLAGEYAYTVVADGFEDASGNVTVVDEDVTVTVTMIAEEVILPVTEFFENFDGVTAPALPEGWSKIVVAGNTTADVQTSTLSFQVSEPNHIRMLNGNDANPTMLLIGPKITNFESNWLTFWGRNNSAVQTADVAIGYMSNPADESTFVGVDTVSLEGNVYQKFYFAYDGLVDEDEFFIAFKYLPLVNFRTIYMDDFTWELAPENAILAIVPEEGDFDLVDVNDTSELTFTIQNVGSGTLTINDGDMVFGGADADLFSLDEDIVYPISLAMGEQYVFSIEFAPVSVGDKTATLDITHNGENTPFSFPLTGIGLGTISEFFENFDGVTVPALPGGWSAIVQSTATAANVETITVTVPFSPPNHVRMQNSTDLGSVLMLVSPKVDNFATNWLSFYTKMSLSTHSENVIIGYTTDRYDAAAFVALDTIPVVGNTYTRKTYEFPASLTDTDEYHIVFKALLGVTSRTLLLDDITLEPMPTEGVLAVAPQSFEWEGIFINETSPNATITVSNFGTADLVIADGDVSLTGVDAGLFDLIFAEELVFPLTLEPNQNFQFLANFSPIAEGVFNASISIESGDQTATVALTGGSVDPTVTPTVSYDFIGAFPPLHWTRWAGEFNDSTALTPVTGFWVHGKFGGQAALPANNAARNNIFGASRNHWLITPPINLGDGTSDYMLSFDMALTAWNTANPGTMGPNQYFAVVISPDNGQTWVPANTLGLWDATTPIPNTGMPVTIDLTDYSGIVKIGFYAHSRAGGGDVDIYITNVDVREIEFFSVTFNVKDSGGNDITDATVTFGDETLSAAPYLFEDLLFGNYDYTVSKFGYLPVVGVVEIEDENVVVEVVLLDAFMVDFTVTDGTNPVVGAQIDVFDSSDMQIASILTDADGEASLLVSDGTYTYNVFAVGFDLLEDQTFTVVDVDISVSVVLTGPDPMMLPFMEDFNDTELPVDWIIVNLPNHNVTSTWEVIPVLGTSSIDGTPFAIINSDAAGSGANTLNSMLYTPAIDASGLTGILTLSFEHFYRHLGANAFAKVEVWNGTQWIELAHYTTTQGAWTAPAQFHADITEHANDKLRVRFHYTDGGSWAWYWAIDNVEIVELQEYTLTLSANPVDWGTVSGEGDYLEGSSVEIVATPAAGFAFASWTDNEGDVVSTNATATIVMPSEDYHLTANFIPGVADPITLNTLLNKFGDNLPPEISAGGNARSAALFQERYVVVTSHLDGGNVWVWDMMNPHLDPFALDKGEDVVVPLTFPINYVRTTDSGIYVSNLSLNPSGEGWGQGIYKVYRWTSVDGTPEAVISFNALPGRLGDAISIIGDPAADGHIIAHINTTKQFRKWNFVGGVLQNEATPDTITLDIDITHLNNHGIINPIEGEDDIFVLTSNNIGIKIVDIDGDILASIGTDVIDQRTYDPNIFYFNGNRYLSYTINNEGNADVGARHQIVDISLGETVVEAIEMISSTAVLANRIVYDKVMGAGHPNLTATNQIAFDDDGELMVLAHVVGRGFVLETTGTIPATYALTVEATPAEGGTVTGGGDYYEGATVPVTATPAGDYQFVNWTIGTVEVSTDASFHYTMPAAATTLTANFELIPIIDVSTLAELRTKPQDGTLYRYTGDAVIVAMDGFRNRKFLQDETAAILIDDQPGVITTEYDLYDEITNVVGKINIFNQMVRFQPDQNTEPAAENTPVDPYDFTIPDLTSDDQAKLVKLHNVTFINISDGQVFANGTNYTITDGENNLTVRTDFWNVDYTGEEIPVTPINITGVIIQFNDNLQLVPRFADDFEDYFAPETFAVTFNVNMSTADNFDPASDVVYVTGSMLGWAEPGSDPGNQTLQRVGDSWIWTKTLHLEAGEYAYKYFLNAGWDGGEWGGGDDRMVTVTEDIVLNDFWGSMDPLYELTLVADPAAGGTVAGEGLYAEGEAVTVTATAATNYAFVNWTLGTDVVSTEASFSYTMPAASVTLTANFELQPSVGEIGTVDINVFPNPARDNFNITANSMIRGIVIADITGKVVFNDIINDTQVQIDNVFEAGIYLVRIQTDEGVFVRKLQIQK